MPVPPDDDCAISDDKHQGDFVSALPFDVEHPVTKLLLPADSHRTQVADLGSSLSFEKASFDVMRRSNGPGQQIVGILQTEQELKGHEFYIDVDCNQRAKLVGAPDGSISVFDGVGQIGAVAVPWAYDSSGRTLETGFSIKGDTFSQWIDTSAANFPIVFDPTYSVLDCNFNGRYSNLNAAQYLDMYSSSTNYGYCAPEPLHVRRSGCVGI